MNIIEGVTRCGCMKPNSLQCANAAFVNIKHPDREVPTPTCRLDLNWLVGSLKPDGLREYSFEVINPENQSDLDNIINMHLDPIAWSENHGKRVG